MGKGFPVDTVPPEDVDTVLLFATGTGIAPVKALIESGALQADKRKDVRLYFGTHDNDSTPYKDQCAPPAPIARQLSNNAVHRVVGSAMGHRSSAI